MCTDVFDSSSTDRERQESRSLQAIRGELDRLEIAHAHLSDRQLVGMVGMAYYAIRLNGLDVTSPEHWLTVLCNMTNADVRAAGAA